MKKVLVFAAWILVPLLCGIGGIAIALFTHPDANIDREGWPLAWAGLALGALAGAALTWWLTRLLGSKRGSLPQV
ncbi:hypothetical protein [Roseateles chitosanitabidus]|jgi:high-affinity Fe2+/Pb2+ permease|uniref:hypothetical protein n=1 Tax=Roseateles chitosanitabidus TaxID=65048 RepID=UPI000831FB27|nr:hypothetical protein [Roseateles chitosanitabidus]MBO9685284.1 hypothetical protein [Roseateles chitosanitabidus]